MTSVKPLRLRSQKSDAPAFAAAANDPVAVLWVDTGVWHLDKTFDYLVPVHFDSQISTGVRVGVDFAGRKVEAVVLSRGSVRDRGELKFIEKILSPFPILTREIISLIEHTSRRWLGAPYDLVKAALPGRVISVEKEFQSLEDRTGQPAKSHADVTKSFYLFSKGENPFAIMHEWAQSRSLIGGVLIVIPESRELEQFKEYVSEKSLRYSFLDAEQPRSLRYANFLDVACGSSNIVAGTRSAIFAPVHDLQTIIIFREGAQSHYEVRSPGWNVRDVAIMRSELKGIDLTFAGFAPSSEIALSIEREQIKLVGKKTQVDAQAFNQNFGELLPDRIFTPIRNALKKGSVLFLVPRKGYASALSCKSCRNISLCECGGRISSLGLAKGFRCSLCVKRTSAWVCAWCKKDQPVLLGRGSQRFAQELGRAFPNFPIISSDASTPIDRVEQKHAIVLTTAGMAPSIEGGYSAVVILEGDGLFTQIDLRAHERAREAIFGVAGLLAAHGKVLLVIDNSHPIVSALSSWNMNQLLRRELREREETSLPPYFCAITLDFPHSEVASFVSGIRSAADANRLPLGTRILGPAHKSDDLSRVIVTSPRAQQYELVDFIREYMSRRAISKKVLPVVRVDPYSLS
jgi:primosomal protein N' (replication factor Y)